VGGPPSEGFAGRREGHKFRVQSQDEAGCGPLAGEQGPEGGLAQPRHPQHGGLQRWLPTQAVEFIPFQHGGRPPLEFLPRVLLHGRYLLTKINEFLNGLTVTPQSVPSECMYYFPIHPARGWAPFKFQFLRRILLKAILAVLKGMLECHCGVGFPFFIGWGSCMILGICP
jgi:hypothetical protein